MSAFRHNGALNGRLFFCDFTGIQNFGCIGAIEPGGLTDGGTVFYEAFKDYDPTMFYGKNRPPIAGDCRTENTGGALPGNVLYGDTNPRLRPVDIIGSGDPNGTLSISDGTDREGGSRHSGPPFYYVDNDTGNLWKTLAAGSTVWTLVHAQGTGSPEGVVTAPDGAKYWDRTNKRSYTKTGSGNTGWTLA